MEEPSDEILSQLMREAAMDAKKKGEEAHKKYFEQLKVMVNQRVKEWSGYNSNSFALQ